MMEPRDVAVKSLLVPSPPFHPLHRNNPRKHWVFLTFYPLQKALQAVTGAVTNKPWRKLGVFVDSNAVVILIGYSGSRFFSLQNLLE